jgi:hypothetical protein
LYRQILQRIWAYAKECAKWAAESKNQEDQDLYIDMAKAWTHIALVEAHVSKLASEELSKAGKRRASSRSITMQRCVCQNTNRSRDRPSDRGAACGVECQ